MKKRQKHLDKRMAMRYNIGVDSASGRPQGYTEMYSRGRRGAPAKGVGRATGARVQISPSPPTKTGITLCGACFC